MHFSGRRRELEPVYDVVVEGLIVKIIVLDGPERAARQGKVELKFDC